MQKKDDKKPEDDWQVPESVKQHYAPFRNKKDNLKLFKRVKTKFEIDDHYEIIDSGNDLKKFLLTKYSWSRSLWSCCCRQRQAIWRNGCYQEN